MTKDMDQLREVFNELYQKFPELKEQLDKDNERKDQRKQELINEGLSEQEATIISWNEYWAMVEERDGVTVSFREVK